MIVEVLKEFLWSLALISGGWILGFSHAIRLQRVAPFAAAAEGQGASAASGTINESPTETGGRAVMDLNGNVHWDQAKGHWVNRYGQPINDEFSGLAAEQAINQATKQCEENLRQASQQNWDALSQNVARIAEVDQKLAAEAQLRMESEQATCGGYLAENKIPHEYLEDYRRAGIAMWKTADWSGMFRQVVEELGQRDKAIADFNFFRDRWFQQRQEMVREHDNVLGLYKAAAKQLQDENRRLKELLGKP